MQARGIVRRIDELGRVVIPKELRRTLKIREGEQLEIFAEQRGVMICKYSAVKSILDFVREYADAINSTTGHTILVSDKDNYIYGVGDMAKNYRMKPISECVQDIIDSRKSEIRNDNFINLTSGDNMDYKGEIIIPIMSGGDVYGAIIALSYKPTMSDSDMMLMKTAKAFFGLQF